MTPGSVDACDYKLISQFLQDLFEDFLSRGGKHAQVKEFITSATQAPILKTYEARRPDGKLIPIVVSESCPMGEIRLLSTEGRLLGKIVNLAPPTQL